MTQQRRFRELYAARFQSHGGDAHRIVAVERDVGERRGEAHREGELVVGSGHRHRCARVQKNMNRNLPLRDESSSEKLVETADGVPIDVSNVIAGGVALEALDL